MLFIWMIILLIIVWVSVVYLSLKDESKKEYNLSNIDYKDTEFYNQLYNLNIRQEKILELKKEFSKYIVWSDNLINSIIVAILSNWHILVEWVPWLAKTKTILVLSKLLWLDFKRVQFTPDMLPADLIGWEMYDKNTGSFKIFKWPIFTNLLLADEINRTTPKVQSWLLEAMQEKKVTIWTKTFDLPNPFFVMATQNPVEQEWTFPLPEAQLDRFLLKVDVNYPSFEEEKLILDKFNVSTSNIEPIFSWDDILSMQEEVSNIQVDDNIKDYIINLVESTRKQDEDIILWASTRWIIYLKKASMSVAYLQWKDKVDVEDVKKVALWVLRHRIVLSYSWLSKNIDKILIDKFIHINDYKNDNK